MSDGPEDPRELDPPRDIVRELKTCDELAAIRERHAKRKAATEPHPVFPTEPPAA